MDSDRHDTPDFSVDHFPTSQAFSFVEVAVTSPFQAGFEGPQGQGRPRLYAAAKMETSKTTKYKSLMESSHPKRSLHLAILESTGAFGTGLQALLKLCSQYANVVKFTQSAEQRSWSSSSFSSYWTQRISLGFWRGAFSHSLSFLSRGGERPTYVLDDHTRGPEAWLGAIWTGDDPVPDSAQVPESPTPMRSPPTSSRTAILATVPTARPKGPVKGPVPSPAEESATRPPKESAPRPAAEPTTRRVPPAMASFPSTGPQPATPPLVPPTSLPVYVPDQGMMAFPWGSRPVTIRRPGPGSGPGPLPHPLPLPSPPLVPVPTPGTASVPDGEAKAVPPKAPAPLSPPCVTVAGCLGQAAPAMLSPPPEAKGRMPPPGLTRERVRDLARFSQPG